MPGDTARHYEVWSAPFCFTTRIAEHLGCSNQLINLKYQVAFQPTRPVYYYLTPSGRLQQTHLDEVTRLRKRVISLLKRRHRLVVKRHWPALYDAVCRILYRHDPCFVCVPSSVAERIGMPKRIDQRYVYGGEAADILGWLSYTYGPDDVERIVRNVLISWFGDVSVIARKSRLPRIATQIWDVYRSHPRPELS